MRSQKGRAGRLQPAAEKSGAHPLLVVGNDAADEVGLRVVQRGHQLPQRLLVQLTHRAKHPLLGLGGAGNRTL